jgi:hypothetical protein
MRLQNRDVVYRFHTTCGWLNTTIEYTTTSSTTTTTSSSALYSVDNVNDGELATSHYVLVVLRGLQT